MTTEGPALPASPRAVLLDLDDTLCDHTSARALRLRIAFDMALAGLLEDTRPDLDRVIAESLEIALHGDAHFADVLAPYGVTDQDAINAARSWFRTNRFHGLDLFPDALDVLRWLRRSCPDRRIGIITNGPADVQRAKVEKFELVDLVDAVLISGEAGIEKPDPRVFSTMLDLLGADAGEAVMIGDAPDIDIAGAHEVDIATIWVNRSGQDWPSHLTRPAATVPHIGQVRSLIR